MSVSDIAFFTAGPKVFLLMPIDFAVRQAATDPGRENAGTGEAVPTVEIL